MTVAEIKKMILKQFPRISGRSPRTRGTVATLVRDPYTTKAPFKFDLYVDDAEIGKQYADKIEEFCKAESLPVESVTFYA